MTTRTLTSSLLLPFVVGVMDTRLLSDRHAVVFGRWSLARSESYTNVGGLFTLVLERRPQGWRIAHDHASARNGIETHQQDSVKAAP